MHELAIIAAIFAASVISASIGTGVAFAAIPILGLTGMDLVHGIQPVALFLNGITALFAAISFGLAGHVDWRRAFALSIVATIFTPLGALAAQHVHAGALWMTYFAALIAVVYLMVAKRKRTGEGRDFIHLLLYSAPISVLSGLLGVGPGCLLVPLMILFGHRSQRAAAINAVAVTPASFASVVPHLETASVAIGLVVPIAVSAAAGALLGGYLSSQKMPEKALRGLFLSVVLSLSVYKAVSLFGDDNTQQSERAVAERRR